MFTATWTNLDALRERVRMTTTRMRTDIAVEIGAATDAAIFGTKVIHPYHDQTGTLTRSLRRTRRTSVSATIEALAPYASFVEEGTPRHPIPAKPGGWLVFEDSRTGKLIRKKLVNHPGTKPYPFFKPMADAIEQRMTAFMHKLLRDAFPEAR